MARSAAVLLRRKAALGLRTWQLLHEERARQRSVLMGVVVQLPDAAAGTGRATRAESVAMARWQARAAALKLAGLQQGAAGSDRQLDHRHADQSGGRIKKSPCPDDRAHSIADEKRAQKHDQQE